MNASQIISDDMTLEEKLAAIDNAMATMQAAGRQKTNDNNIRVDIDPSEALMCEGCQ